jgi:hypothetical protein|tara:strand:+ start:80 stop:460 length:381 start_codon:yes stop_codon:yes gene_type:complete
MGRYYEGDIDGKFWFGVQSSSDADYFGVEGTTPGFLDYHFEEDDKDKVAVGISECKRYLGDYEDKLDKFFDDLDGGYNNEMLIKVLGVFSEKDVRRILEWYARLQLGQKIYDCIKEKGWCHFQAEL